MKVEVATDPFTSPERATDRIHRKVIDWNDSSDRKWLMNHMHWAMNNLRAVTIKPEVN